MNETDCFSKKIILEDKAQELITLMFDLCEERIATSKEQPVPIDLALATSALTVQKAIAVFFAIERISY